MSCKNIFKKSSRRLLRHLQDVFKTSSRHLQEVLQRYLQDVIKVYHQVKLYLLTRLRDVFNTFLRRSFPKTVIYRGICLGNTTFEQFMVSVQNLQERQKLIKYQFFTLLHLLMAAYRGVFRTWPNIYNDVLLRKYLTSQVL